MVAVVNKAQIITSTPTILYADRDPAASNRAILANSLEGAVKNDVEKNKLNEYKSKIDLIEAEQKKLSELRSQIKDISFSKGKRDTANKIFFILQALVVTMVVIE